MASTYSAARSGHDDTGHAFGFEDVARVLRSHGRLVLTVMLGVVALAGLVLLIWPPGYSSTAVVMLDPRKNNITDRSQVLTQLPTDPSSVQDQIQILTSRDLASRVIRRLGLAQDKEFNRALSPFPLNLLARGLGSDEQHSMIVDAFLKHLTAESEGLSTAISVRFSANDPGKSARIANAIVDAYVNGQVEQKSDAARRATQWLTTRIRELSRQDQAAEAAVQAYKAANDLNDTGQGTQSLVDQQLATINTQLVQARADLAEKVATDEHVAGLVKSGHAADVSQVVASPLMVQLREQQADAIRNEADLDSRYGPRHPKRIAVELQLRDLDGKVEQEAQRIAGSAANDVAVARAQVQSLETSLGEARTEFNAENLARVKLKALEASAASTRSMYESFVTRLRETQDQDAVDTPDARIISHATAPARPSSPPRLLIGIASAPAGFLLGLLCALFMERRGYGTGPLWGQNSVARNDPAPVVGVVPDVLEPRAADRIVSDPSSPFAQALFAMAARLIASGEDRRPRTILISGPDRREGRTNVAVGLARALANLEQRVILIDADFAVSAAAWSMGLHRAQSGLLDVLKGAQPLGVAAAKDMRSPALVLASVRPPANPSALWNAPEMRELLVHLRQTCDFIVIDAPVDDDTPTIARLADAVLVVGKAGSAARLKGAAAALAGWSASLAAIVLTR